ncbi:hypothetical protein Efla_000596 [Eimeria flavescens]
MLNQEPLAAQTPAEGSSASPPPLVDVSSTSQVFGRQQSGGDNGPESDKERESSTRPAAGKQPKRFSRLKQKGSAMLDTAFARHGMLVYDHAWKFVIGFALLSGIMALGIFFRKNEFDMYRLYSYPGAPSHNLRQRLESTFMPQRFNYFFVSRDDNILTREGMTQLNNLVTAVKKLTVNKDDVVTDEFGNDFKAEDHSTDGMPDVMTYEDLCVRDSWNDCSIISVLELYGSERQWGRPITTRDWPLAVNMYSKKAFHLDALLGDMRVAVLDQGGHKVHRVTGATASLLRFDLLGDATVAPYTAALEKKIEEVAKAFNAPGYSLSYKLERSISDELMRSSMMGPAETVALVLATLTVLGYTVVVNTTTSYRTKTIPAVVCVASTLLGYAGGAGFIYFCGVEHTPPADATPFLVLGIGVDNAFVLLNSYCLTFLHESPRQRIISTARDAGVSITITTMTSVAALIIGAVCPFFSISKFSIVTAFCLAWSYVLAQTIFLGCLSLDARREAYQTRVAKAAVAGPHQEYHRQSALDRLPSPGNSDVKSPQSLESNHGSDSLGSPISFQDRSSPYQKRYLFPPGAEPDDPLQDGQQPQGTPSAAPRQNVTSQSAEGHSVEIQGNSKTLRDTREAELLSGLRKLSTYELASLITFRMQHIWHGHRQTVPQYFHDMPGGIDQEEAEAPGLGNLFGLWNRKTKVTAAGQEQQAKEEPPPLRGPSLEAGDPRRESATGKIDQSRVEGERPLMAERIALENELAREEPLGVGAAGDIQEWNKESALDSGPRLVRMRLGKPADGYILMEEKEFLFVVDKYITEPKGNVGKMYRRLLGKYYCRQHFLRWLAINRRLMGNKWVRRLIFGAFAALVAAAMYGVTRMKTGIQAREITPTDSHLIPFFEDRAKYFSSLGEEVTVFFPKKEDWAKREVQQRLLDIHKSMVESGHALALYNGMVMFLQAKKDSLPDGNTAEFHSALHKWLQSDPVGRQFRTSFLWDTQPSGAPGPRLVAWKFTFWLPHSLDADSLLDWFKQTQRLLKNSDGLFEGHAFTPLALLWESDPFTVKSTVNSLLSALLAIICMTVLLIPDLLSVLIVAFTVMLIDLCLFGFMTLWGLRLNLITMVNLLLAIGYSVDSTLFLLHAFTHGCGATREARMTEGMLMMGCPVANGMLSTLLAVFYLVGTTKFVLIAFFRMMVLVLVLSFGFGMILLPAVLCIIGPLPPNPPVVSYVLKHNAAKAASSVQSAAAELPVEAAGAGAAADNALAYDSQVLKKSD